MRSVTRLAAIATLATLAACGEQNDKALIGPQPLHPHFKNDGISGYSGAPGAELCSRCHDADNGAAAPTVTVSGPTTVGPGESNTYTLTIQPASGSNQTQGGLNVAVDGGTLTAGSGTQIDAGEIVQSSPQAGSGSLSWSFGWQAPATAGDYNMYGVGLSTDGKSTSGDEEGTDVLTITVQAGNSPPAADAKSVSADKNTSAPITLSASDAETCELAFSIVSGPAHGSLSGMTDRACGGSGPFSDRAELTYTPTTDYVGPDQFTYSVTDQDGLSSDAVVEITVLDPSAVDYDLVRLRVKKDKDNKLVAAFTVKNTRRRVQADVQAELYVDDTSGFTAAPTCTMMVSDDPAGGASSHWFASSTGCDFVLDKRIPPTTYEVTVRLADDSPDTLTKTLRVRRFSRVLSVFGMIQNALRGGM